MKDSRSKGFTLIEIVIALAIMSIVMVAASRFMMSVLSQYSKDNYDIKLQTEVEEILNLVENKVMGADGAQVTSDGELQIYFSGDSENYLFYLNDTDYYYAKNGDKSLRVYLGTHVSSVDYKVTESTVTVNLHMAYRGSTYDASRNILLRNSATVGSTSSLLSQIGAYINSAKSVTVNADGSLSIIDETGKQQIIRLDTTAGSVKCGDTVLGTDVSKLTFSMSEDKKSVHVIVKTKDDQTLERDYEIGTSTGETKESGEDSENGTASTEESNTEETTAAQDSSSNVQGGTVILPSQDDTSNTTPSDSSSENSDSNTTPSQEENNQESAGQQQTATPETVNFTVDTSSSYINKKTYEVVLKVTNTGDTLLWKDVKLRYYFIHPEAQTVVLDSLGDDLNRLGATATFGTLEQDYVGATDYVDLTFSSEAVFSAGSSQNMEFSLKYSSEQEIETDGVDYDMLNSYSGQSTSNVILYYQDEIVVGNVPNTPLDQGTFFPVVTACNVTNNGSNFEIEVKVKNKGASVSWKDVTLRLYDVQLPRETLYMVDGSKFKSSRSGVTGTVSWSSDTFSDVRYKDANGYMTISCTGSDQFIHGEEVTFKFTVKYSSGTNMSDDSSQNSFSLSHFLKGAENVVVYQGSTKKCGNEPSEIVNNIVNLDACNPVVVSRADGYNGNQNEYTFVTNLQNQGQTLDLSKLELRVFYINPDRYTMQVNSSSAKLTDYNNRSLTLKASLEDTKQAYTDAEHYASLKFSGDDGKLYPYETLQATVKLQYSDGSVMSGGNASNCFSNSFSLKEGTTYIAVYYDGTLISGNEPATQSELADCKPVVIYNGKSKSGSNYIDIQFDVQNQGRTLDYSKLEFRYYYTTSPRRTLNCNGIWGYLNTAYTSNLTYEMKNLTTPMEGAVGYISIKVNDTSFYTYDTASINLSLYYDGWKDMFSSQLSQDFQNSYSLESGVNTVVIYYDGKRVFGVEPSTEVGSLSSQVEIKDFNASLSDDQYSYTVSFTLANKGGDLDLSKLYVYFYYIKPSGTTLEIQNVKNIFYDSNCDQNNGLQFKSMSDDETDDKYTDATRKVTFGFGANDKLYRDEQVTVQFELKLKKNGSYVAVNDTTATYGFGKSHSLKQGSFCEVVYNGSTLYGYGPTEVMEEDTTTTTTSGPLPDITTVSVGTSATSGSWNGWDEGNQSGYWYSFYFYCANMDEIDPTKITVCLYLYFGNKEGSTNTIYCDGNSGFSSMSYNILKTLKGSSNWKISFNEPQIYSGGCTIQANIRKKTNYKVDGEADQTKCYSVSADTIEIYYGDTLVWPKS